MEILLKISLNISSCVSSFQQPPLYGVDTLERGSNLETQYRFNSGISIIERLTPLIGIDVTTMRDGNITKNLFKHL